MPPSKIAIHQDELRIDRRDTAEDQIHSTRYIGRHLICEKPVGYMSVRHADEDKRLLGICRGQARYECQHASQGAPVRLE